jgi:hypothetical protein
MGRLASAAAGIAGVLALLLGAGSPAAGAEWLPRNTVYPRDTADPMETRLGLTLASGGDRVEAALGAPVPLVALGPADRPVAFVLEGGAFLRLGRDGSFFPLETVDGRFGLGVETRIRRAAVRLRILHWSAHAADGDTGVTYRGRTVSQEFAELEAGMGWGSAFTYLRLGGAWHAVPPEHGVRVAAGGRWDLPHPVTGAFLALHLAADAQRNWRASRNVLLGWEFGGARRAPVALRGVHGFRPHGQYLEIIENYWGLDIQFSP